MIRQVSESIGRAILDGIGRAASRVQERKPLPADLLESDDAYLAVFDAPGSTAGDVKVRFQKQTLTVQIDRFRDHQDGYEMRFPGRGLTLRGKVTFPDGAETKADSADATLTSNGTLEVLIPKADAEVDASPADTVSETESASASNPTEMESETDSSEEASVGA